ncbi:sugar ABC transporter permease [candidate division KSB3 bacterium]|uniref:Sugar ABC transporter permease n=1 Tax=candidate division KSB3 bacterium TaxID=2044937 RepID=A0A2G6E8E2_9BACT|nr:MAG: sugar ABC transporter permease [candidate division KSB3 bacterium]PIE30512.1 MAG: sugar ABC transporter permease [candidate division KSB3 bacterium]
MTDSTHRPHGCGIHVFRPEWQHILGYLFVLPLLLWLAGTILYPLLSTVYLSMQNIKIIGSSGKFVGIENYLRVFSSLQFWAATWRSLLWVLGNAVLQTLLAFAVALILQQQFKGRQFVRLWIILPWIVPTVVVVVIWRWLLTASGGIVNYLLLTIGIIDEPIGFFSTAGRAFLSVIVINSWRWFPFVTVILLAALLRIPRELYEASGVDGASARQQFVHITLPGLQPVLFVLGLVGTLLSFNVFDVIWLLTGGGPSSGTATLPVLIYETAFKKYRLSQAAAMSVIVGLFLLVFAALFIHYMAPSLEEEHR